MNAPVGSNAARRSKAACDACASGLHTRGEAWRGLERSSALSTRRPGQASLSRGSGAEAFQAAGGQHLVPLWNGQEKWGLERRAAEGHGG